MDISVIVTTYNHPRWLEKVIWGYAEQTHKKFEMVIADDGSTELTRRTIDGLRRQAGFEIRHVWHDDQGIRKCRILNKAIAASRHEYLVFTDGDCISRPDFLDTHDRLTRRNCFLSGGCVRLPLEVSRLLSREDIQKNRATNVSWLWKHGLPAGRKLRLLTRNPVLARIYDAVSTTKASFNGHNTSVWKRDVIRVNGFDERMQYGGLDRELGERLMNIGVIGVRVRHRAACVHLDHPRPYRNSQLIQHNLTIREHTSRSGEY